jgi:hypothetical protein
MAMPRVKMAPGQTAATPATLVEERSATASTHMRGWGVLLKGIGHGSSANLIHPLAGFVPAYDFASLFM